MMLGSENAFIWNSLLWSQTGYMPLSYWALTYFFPFSIHFR